MRKNSKILKKEILKSIKKSKMARTQGTSPRDPYTPQPADLNPDPIEPFAYTSIRKSPNNQVY